MTDEEITKAAREICAAQAGKKDSPESYNYLAGNYDHTIWMRLVEQGIWRGLEGQTRQPQNDYDDDQDNELALPERYIERAGETLAYRLMDYLEFLGVIGKDHVSFLRYPPIEFIEDAEKALRDEV